VVFSLLLSLPLPVSSRSRAPRAQPWRRPCKKQEKDSC
jgi:hypothetical protein